MRRIARFRVHGVPAPPSSTDRAKRVARGLRPRQPSFPYVLGTILRESQQNRILQKINLAPELSCPVCVVSRLICW